MKKNLINAGILGVIIVGMALGFTYIGSGVEADTTVAQPVAWHADHLTSECGTGKFAVPPTTEEKQEAGNAYTTKEWGFPIFENGTFRIHFTPAEQLILLEKTGDCGSRTKEQEFDKLIDIATHAFTGCDDPIDVCDRSWQAFSRCRDLEAVICEDCDGFCLDYCASICDLYYTGPFACWNVLEWLECMTCCLGWADLCAQLCQSGE